MILLISFLQTLCKSKPEHQPYAWLTKWQHRTTRQLARNNKAPPKHHRPLEIPTEEVIKLTLRHTPFLHKFKGDFLCFRFLVGSCGNTSRKKKKAPPVSTIITMGSVRYTRLARKYAHPHWAAKDFHNYPRPDSFALNSRFSPRSPFIAKSVHRFFEMPNWKRPDTTSTSDKIQSYFVFRRSDTSADIYELEHPRPPIPSK